MQPADSKCYHLYHDRSRPARKIQRLQAHPVNTKMASVHLIATNAFLVTILLTLLLNVSVTRATSQHTCSILSRPHPRGLCGPTLANMVQWLCSTYSTSNKVKRQAEPDEVDEALSKVMISKKRALSYLTKRESRPNIVCECCFNSCSVQELLAYC